MSPELGDTGGTHTYRGGVCAVGPPRLGFPGTRWVQWAPPRPGLPRTWWVQWDPPRLALPGTQWVQWAPQDQGSLGHSGCNCVPPPMPGLAGRTGQEVVPTMPPYAIAAGRCSLFHSPRAADHQDTGLSWQGDAPCSPTSCSWTWGFSHPRWLAITHVSPPTPELGCWDKRSSFSASRQLNATPGRVLFVTPWECVLAVPRLALAFGLAWKDVAPPVGGGEQKTGG